MWLKFLNKCLLRPVFVGEASGKPLARVPYLHGGFEVTGLPEGVSFKKPTAYGSNTIQAIMKNAEKIKFNIAPKEVGLAPSRGQETLTEAAKQKLSKKILDNDKIAGCLSREKRIFEQDLQVTNLDLLANEFRLLVTDLSDHFEKDAILSLISNYQSSLTHQGYVLPVYTDTEEPYWLFYFPGGSCEMESLHSQDKIWGCWLDKTSSNLEYRLLLNRSSIVALNVVCYDGELGSLRFKTNISLCDGVSIVLPSDFHASILKCLKEQGFL